MRIGGTSSQYGVPYVVITEDDTPAQVIAFAREQGAIYNDGKDDCIVVAFDDRLEVIEIYTPRALRKSMMGDD